MFENRVLSFTLNLLAEIHYLQFLSLYVGDKAVISSKKAQKGLWDDLCVFSERCFVKFLISSCEILLL